MRKIYLIENFRRDDDELYFILNDSDDNIQLQPAKQVIADSDNFAFIYLLDEGETYHYVRFEPTIWPQLVEMLKEQKNPSLVQGHQTIAMEDFYQELEMLLYNIEGNHNYGEDFTKTVEQAFAVILQDNN